MIVLSHLSIKGIKVVSAGVPSSPKAAMSESPTYWTRSVASENLRARGTRSRPAGAMWVVKSFRKKFQESCPLTENMATRLAESIPSLRNFNPMPGAVPGLGGAGSLAWESLAYPLVAPWKMPV